MLLHICLQKEISQGWLARNAQRHGSASDRDSGQCGTQSQPQQQSNNGNSVSLIIGFNATLATVAREAADAVGVDVRKYNIIYKHAKVDERHI